MVARLAAAFVSIVVLLPRALGFAVIGYVPEYRWEHFDWETAVSQVTHLVLFSIEPTEDGELQRANNIVPLLKENGSRLRAAMQNAGQAAPKIIVTLGGAGRSANFAKAASSKKARKKVASRLKQLFEACELLDGVDLDWQKPENPEQWRNLGKLATDIRSALTPLSPSHFATPGRPIARPDPVLSMTYHPRSGAVNIFSGLRGKSGTTFVDLFDLCFAMTYSQLDGERRHSSQWMDMAAADEWSKSGLPLNKFVLGIPFFGISKKTAEPVTYSEIVEAEPLILKKPDVDETNQGVYFINVNSAKKKVRWAGQKGLGGVMAWELGQDKPKSSSGGAGGLQKTIWYEAQMFVDSDGIMSYLKFWRWIGEDQVFQGLTALLGVFFMIKVFRRTPPSHAFGPMLEKHAEAYHAAEKAKAEAAKHQQKRLSPAAADASEHAEPSGNSEHDDSK